MGRKLRISVVFLLGFLCLSGAPFIGAQDVLITEIHYNVAPDNSGGEYVEVSNRGAEDVDIGGWILTEGVDFTFPPGTTISPGEFLIVAADEAQAEAFYEVEVIGQYNGRLGNGGDTLLLQDDSLVRQVIDVVLYDDEAPWPADADGGGFSIELVDVQVDNGLADSWGLGQPYSPGAANDSRVQGVNSDLVITEIMYKPRREEQREKFDRVNRGFYFEDSDDEFGEYVELQNIGEAALDISGWTFSDGIIFSFPEGVVVEPGQRVVVVKDPEIMEQRFGLSSGLFGPFEGELNDAGERVTVRNAEDEVMDTVGYDDSFPWPTGPDELGYSLECLDPFSDNSSASNWRASKDAFPLPGVRLVDTGDGEGDGWIFFTAEDTATSNRLYLFLDGPGEWLLDEVSLVPTRTEIELIVNGDFNGNDEGWLKVGNHETSFWTEADSHDGNGALRIVSTGAGRSLADCLQMRRINGVAPGQKYTFSFWAKYLSGARSLTVRLSGGAFESTITPGGGRSELAVDWSDMVNPNVFWTCADASGKTLSDQSLNWLAAELGSGQPAWTVGGDDGRGGWCRSIGMAPEGDLPEGRVGTLAPSRLIWTSPGLGEVEFGGGVWLMRHLENGDHTWTLRLNERIVSEGTLVSGDPVNSASPMAFASGSGGEGALLQVLEHGDVLSLSIQPAAGQTPGFVGVDITSVFRRGIAPEPPIAGALGTGSPGRLNSRDSNGVPPAVRELRHLVEKPTSADDVGVVARVYSERAITSVELFYQIDLETQAKTIEMKDDGAHQDGAADDGVYGALVPGQSSPSFVNYWVRVVDEDGLETTAPHDDDASSSQAYFHFDNDLNTVLTTYHLYISHENLSKIRSNPRSSEYVNAHMAIDGIAYPNIGARFRGRGSRTHSKNQWKFQFHKSHLYKGNRILDTMVNQPLVQEAVFDIFQQSGVFNIDSELVRLHHNGPFWGVYSVFESPNATWVRKYGLPEDTEIYKARSVETAGEARNSDLYPNQLVSDWDFWGAWNKKVRPLHPPSHIRELTKNVNEMADEELLPWVDKNIDLEQYFGRWALYILTNVDDFAGHNFYLLRQGGEGGKWQRLAYDFDSGFTYSRVGSLTVFYGDGRGGSPAWQRNKFMNRVSSNRTLSQIYLLRMREMLDFYQENVLLPPIQELFNATATERSTERIRTMRGSLGELTSVFRGQRSRMETEIERRGLPGADKVPSARPVRRVFQDSVIISLIAEDGWATFYTLDGSDPRLSTESQVYSEPFEVTESTSVKAAAIPVDPDSGEPLLNRGGWTDLGEFFFEEDLGIGVGPFVRGDCNGDGIVGGDVSDAVAILLHAFAGSFDPPCHSACDTDTDGRVTTTDAFLILRYSFLGEAFPAAPFPSCASSELATDIGMGCVDGACP